MAVLFGRRCKLTILGVSGTATGADVTVLEISGEGDLTSPGLRVKFHVCKSTEKDPNTADITVTNLAEPTRRSIQLKGLRVLLEAGYQGAGVTGIFAGQTRTVDHVREKADWNTILKCGDGEQFYNYARFGDSFKGVVPALRIVNAIAKAMGVSVGTVGPAAQARLNSFTFQHGWTRTGSARRAMDALLKGIGLTWSIQSGTIQILAPDDVLNLQIPLITPDTGLVGSPEMGSPEQNGKPALCKFKALLLPTQPGAVVHLTSDRYNTDVKVVKCEFDGDTHGAEWFTTIYGELLKS